jgi:hypothetical protein
MYQFICLVFHLDFSPLYFRVNTRTVNCISSNLLAITAYAARYTSHETEVLPVRGRFFCQRVLDRSDTLVGLLPGNMASLQRCDGSGVPLQERLKSVF